MWSAGSDVFDVYLGVAIGGLMRGGERAMWQSHATVDAGAGVLFEHARKQARKPVRVWLSGALARPFLCGPVQGLKRWSEVTAVAQAMAHDATGLAAPCEVQVETWPSPHAALAVAIDPRMRLAIEAAAREHGLALQSLRPWWAAAFNQVLASAPGARLVAVADSDALTLLGGDDERVHTASAYVPRPSDEQAGQSIARLALTAGVGAAQMVRVRLARGEMEAGQGVPFGMVLEAGA